jgi:hypothetical protein
MVDDKSPKGNWDDRVNITRKGEEGIYEQYSAKEKKEKR